MYDIIIIGAGAAGLFLAANLQNKKVLLLEKMKSPGNKILITGSGMCNITNTDDLASFLTHFGDKKKANFLKPAMMNLSNEMTRAWFEAQGLPLTVREDGKVFPKTMKAQTVVDTLLSTAKSNRTEIAYSQVVKKVDHSNEIFTVQTEGNSFESRNLVISTGGKGYEVTGSDGSGYPLARALGHSIIEPTQALVGVMIKEYGFAGLSGNATRNSFVEFYRQGESKRYLQASGDLLFTHKGVSGPVIINNSRFIHNGDLLKVSLIPTDNKDRSREELNTIFPAEPKKQLSTILKKLGLYGKLIVALYDELEITMEITCGNLPKRQRKALINLLLEYPLEVSRKGYFSSAMVTAGGIDLSEVDRRTMGSKKVSGLYFAGEILDIDGDSGGYNLQVAFSTAKLIADHLDK